MRIALSLLAVAACRSDHVVPTHGTTAGSAHNTPGTLTQHTDARAVFLDSIHMLDVTVPSGCTRKNKQGAGTTKEQLEWVEVRCEAGDKDIQIEIAVLAEGASTVDEYIAERKREKWRALNVTAKDDKLADGWVAVFSFDGDTTRLVDSVRTIAGRTVACGASGVPADDVERVLATCKSMRLHR